MSINKYAAIVIATATMNFVVSCTNNIEQKYEAYLDSLEQVVTYSMEAQGYDTVLVRNLRKGTYGTGIEDYNRGFPVFHSFGEYLSWRSLFSAEEIAADIEAWENGGEAHLYSSYKDEGKSIHVVKRERDMPYILSPSYDDNKVSFRGALIDVNGGKSENARRQDLYAYCNGMIAAANIAYAYRALEYVLAGRIAFYRHVQGIYAQMAKADSADHYNTLAQELIADTTICNGKAKRYKIVADSLQGLYDVIDREMEKEKTMEANQKLKNVLK